MIKRICDHCLEDTGALDRQGFVFSDELKFGPKQIPCLVKFAVEPLSDPETCDGPDLCKKCLLIVLQQACQIRSGQNVKPLQSRFVGTELFNGC